jgi:hypothetical protein
VGCGGGGFKKNLCLSYSSNHIPGTCKKNYHINRITFIRPKKKPGGVRWHMCQPFPQVQNYRVGS